MEQPRAFSDVFSNRAPHGITIYQRILIYQETIGARLSCAFYWTRSSGSPPDGIEQYLEPEVRGDYEGLLRLATGKNRLVRTGDPTMIGSPAPLRNPLGLPWQPKIRMRIIAGVAERSSRSVYAAIGVSGFAELMLRYKAIR